MNAPLDRNARVLVVVPAWVGDAVMAEPAIRALHRHLGVGAEGAGSLTLTGPVHLLELLRPGLPGVEVLPVDRKSGTLDLARKWHGFDAAVLLPGSFRSALAATLARIPRRIGWMRDGRGWLLTDGARPALERGDTPLFLGIPGRRPRVLPRPYVTACTELLALVGVATPTLAPRITVAEAVRAGVMDDLRELELAFVAPGPGSKSSPTLRGGAAYHLVNAGGRPGSSKALPAQVLADAIGTLVERDARPVLLVCGPGEQGTATAALTALGRDPSGPRRGAAASRGPRIEVWIDPPPTLPELAVLAEGASVFVTADSGPRHIAQAVGCPTAVAMGPSDPRHTTDSPVPTSILRHPVPCGPCHRERCPLPEHSPSFHACMAELDGNRLGSASSTLLGSDP